MKILDSFRKKNRFPKIVHLIYIPWERETGLLKEDENDFDHRFYENFKMANPDWEIKLWTQTKVRNFVNEQFPEYSKIWSLVSHPTQIVDFARLLVTYHYGGIFYHYDSIQKTPLESLLPRVGKEVDTRPFPITT